MFDFSVLVAMDFPSKYETPTANLLENDIPMTETTH